MAKQKKSMIGLDPLAWLKDEAEDAEIIEEDKAVSKEKPKKKTATKKTASKKTAARKTSKIKNKDSDDDVIFNIQAVQDISTVAEVHSELKALLSNKKVLLEVSEIERIDAASLQLLYSFIEQAKSENVEILWRSPSDVLSNNAKLLGMEDALQLNNIA